MRIKTLYTIGFSANPSGEMAAETTSILDPQTAWVRSTMTEAKIQALVDRGLLRPKAEVEWKAAAGRSSRPRHQGAGRLRVLLQARLQPPHGGFPPRLVVLLQVIAGTSCPQLHYCSFDLHSFL
jgi:hypothetical protein